MSLLACRRWRIGAPTPGRARANVSVAIEVRKQRSVTDPCSL